MTKRQVTSGQTIYDLAILMTGSVEGLFLLLKDNPTLNLTIPLVEGTWVIFKGEPINPDVVKYYADNGYNPETFTEDNTPDIPLESLKLWLKANDGPVTSGTDVTTWQDKSGNDNHAGPVEGKAPPTLVNNDLNDLPVVQMDNDGLGYTGDFIANADHLTIYAVVKASSPSGYGWLWQMSAPGDYSSVSLVTWTNPSLFAFFTNGGSTVVGYTSSSSTGTWYILTIRVNNDNANKLRMYKDGVIDTTATDESFDPITQGYKLGYNPIGDLPFIGKLAEYIVYDVEHDNDTATAIQNYLKNKYDL